MKRIQLWSVDQIEPGSLRAIGLNEKTSTETEQHLEELLVGSPDLIAEGLTFVARQFPTEAGFPDLLGIDQDGRLVVLELKRGTLTRDAVAQVLDYGSDLGMRDIEELSRLIEEHSGRAGITEIEDFRDWYNREYPNDSETLTQTPPRMMLVGLGVDERAKRIVNFLAETGVDIQLLTFHAFDLEGKLLLAKQVETVEPSAPPSRGSGSSKQENRTSLMALAEQHGVRDLLVEVADYIAERLPCYRWPGKTAYSFSLHEKTEAGSPTMRSYMTLYVDYWQRPKTLVLTLAHRARDAAPEAVKRFVEDVPEAKWQENSSKPPVEVEITEGSWQSLRDPLDSLLAAIHAGWKKRSAAQDAEDA